MANLYPVSVGRSPMQWPSGPLRLNAQDPLARGLVFAAPLFYPNPYQSVGLHPSVGGPVNDAGTGPIRPGFIQGLDWDGADDYVIFSNPYDINTNAPFTVMAWIYPDSINQANGQYLFAAFQAGDAAAASVCSIETNSGSAPGRLSITVVHSTTNISRTTPNNFITLGEWQHVAFRWDGGTVASSNLFFWRNGVLSSGTHTNNNGSGTPVDAGGSFTIGGSLLLPTTRAFNGSIRDLRVYNRPVPTVEVVRAYNPDTRFGLYYQPPRQAYVFLGGALSSVVFDDVPVTTILAPVDHPRGVSTQPHALLVGAALSGLVDPSPGGRRGMRFPQPTTEPGGALGTAGNTIPTEPPPRFPRPPVPRPFQQGPLPAAQAPPVLEPAPLQGELRRLQARTMRRPADPDLFRPAVPTTPHAPEIDARRQTRPGVRRPPETGPLPAVEIPALQPGPLQVAANRRLLGRRIQRPAEPGPLPAAAPPPGLDPMAIDPGVPPGNRRDRQSGASVGLKAGGGTLPPVPLAAGPVFATRADERPAPPEPPPPPVEVEPPAPALLFPLVVPDDGDATVEEDGVIGV